MQADRPGESFVPFFEPALHQITNHGNDFLKCIPLSRHFWIVTHGDEGFILLLNIEGEFLLHGYECDFTPRATQAAQCAAFPETDAACSLKDLPRPVGAITESMMPR
jgi:hypothetical protein